MAIEIVDLPIKNGGSFHSYVNVYQRVYPNTSNSIPTPVTPCASITGSKGSRLPGPKLSSAWQSQAQCLSMCSKITTAHLYINVIAYEHIKKIVCINIMYIHVYTYANEYIYIYNINIYYKQATKVRMRSTWGYLHQDTTCRRTPVRRLSLERPGPAMD